MHVASIGTALPPHRYEQGELIAAMKELWAARGRNGALLDRLQRTLQIGSRNLALPLEAYSELADFGAANDAFIRVGTDLGEQAMRSALEEASLAPRDIDAVFFTTVTGLAVPSIDARLANRLGLRPDVKRVPLFGLGCVAGAAGTARLYDYLRAWPDHVAVLLSVELCSLTLQRGDISLPNVIASGLFGDGAAALVGVGAERARRMGLQGPQILATGSRLYPNTEHVLGWEIGAGGFKIVLDAAVSDLVAAHIGDDIDGFLDAQGLARRDVASWVCHPGGPKVLRTVEAALDLEPEALALSWRSLSRKGNLSSASVLFILRDTMRERPGARGTKGLMFAMGPGFSVELVLFRW